MLISEKKENYFNLLIVRLSKVGMPVGKGSWNA